MGSLTTMFERFKRGPQDIVGLDIQPSAVTAVRMIRTPDGGASVQAADLLPGIAFPDNPDDKSVPALTLPAKLKAKYAALCLSSRAAIVKLISFPGEFTPEQEEKAVQGLGLNNPDNYRISYKITAAGRGKAESKVLMAALPEAESCRLPKLLPSGVPAPFSLEISDLAMMTAFLNTPNSGKEHASAILHFGMDTCTLGIFNKGALALIRRFPVGAQTLIAKVMESLGVNEEVAQGIVSDGAFDISQAVSEVIAPLAKQMKVSRDFVERREDCKIATLSFSGSLAKSNDVVNEIRSEINIEPKEWNPLEGATVADGAVPEELAKEPWRLAAALGAGQAVFEET